MFRSWKLGTAFGIGVFVHWSFLLLPLVVIMSSPQSGWLAALHILVLIAAVFGCVVLHELGHALTARHFGIGTRDITLYPIGGVARLEKMSEKPWEEFWIAVMGPAVNVAIIAVLSLILVMVSLVTGFDPQHLPFGVFFLLELMVINAIMVVFNMIPAFPMDGGRVLRALLANGLGHLRATEIAARVGLVFSALIILAGLGTFASTGIPLMPHRVEPFMILVGAFVLLAGQQELFMVRQQARIRELQRRGLWPWWYEGHPSQQPPQAEIVVNAAPGPAPFGVDQSAQPTEPNFSGFTWDADRRAWIEWRNGRPVHICWVK